MALWLEPKPICALGQDERVFGGASMSKIVPVVLCGGSGTRL